jgi:hypothetical protein
MMMSSLYSSHPSATNTPTHSLALNRTGSTALSL